MARTDCDLPRLTGPLEPRGAWTASACSLARALDVVSTRSAFLLLREAFYGTARFDDFAERAGVSEPVAAARLRDLVGAGLLTREQYREPGQRARLAYRLTDKGADLFPALAALMQWGDRWLSPDGGPIGLRHRDCGEPVEVELRCAAGHRTGPAELDLVYRDGRREARLPGPVTRPDYPARWLRIWRLMRDSIAAMPRSRSGLTRSFSPSWPVNSSGVASTSSAPRPSSPACRMLANPRVVGASGGASKNRCTTSPSSTSTARNNGDWHSGTCSSRSRRSA